MARRVYFSVSCWQLFASVPLIFCLVSKEWIISPHLEETRGLFGVCRKGNSSCNTTSGCAPCSTNGTELKCGDFGDDPQGLDREMIGGILATVLLARGIIFAMSIVSLIARQDAPRRKNHLPPHITLLEEVSGAMDIIVVAIYLAYNNILLVENPCRSYGAGFWVNFVRSPAGIIYLRLLHPVFMSITTAILAKRHETGDDDKRLCVDEPAVLTHRNEISNEVC